ncbi:hypothetical protein L596_019513 [Steinernema carpocapsae]|uniref:Uncharacterized protein n=1 Tax=Steinernema carpocapsae TaxID=34508 RepID=A0A4U5MQR0_STECR|nr:hypothetical protein L596_019513 [Steinernema carpocapsae]
MSASSSTVRYENAELADRVEDVEIHHCLDRETSPPRTEEHSVRFDVNLTRWRDERSCMARAPEPEFYTAATHEKRYSGGGYGGYNSGARFMTGSIGYVQDRGGLYHASEGRF